MSPDTMVLAAFAVFVVAVVAVGMLMTRLAEAFVRDVADAMRDVIREHSLDKDDIEEAVRAGIRAADKDRERSNE